MSESASAGSLLPSQRALFAIPEDVAYLNCAYMSALPKPALEAGERGLWRKAQPWSVGSADFFAESRAVRALLARLVNAEAADVALVPSVSYAMAQAAHNIRLDAGQTILTLAEEFPSNVYAWRDLAARTGARIATVPRPEDDDWTAALLARIDGATGLVAVPHCHWVDGGLVDLEAVGAACRRVGAALCIDATQSLGALPLDVKRVDPDFLAVAGYKWLLGPYSFSYLYVAKRRQDGRPIEQCWAAREGAENFVGLVDYRDGYDAGARRFDVGEFSNFALTPVAKASLELIHFWGVERIQATLRSWTEAIAARARAELGLDSVAPDRRAGHYLGLRFPGAVPADLAERLAAAGVHVSVRGRAMRVTPHLWATEADIERLFAVLRATLL